MAITINGIMQMVTEDYLQKVNMQNLPTPIQVESDIVDGVHSICEAENTFRSKSDKLRAPQKLCAAQIAKIMLEFYKIIRVKSASSGADPSYDLLAIYQDSGINEGIYATDDETFEKVAKQYNYSITARELADVLKMLRLDAPRVERTMERDLIAVNNGVFDYENKVLLPFSPDYVFLAKSKVNYNPQAINVVIHNPDDNTDWNVEGWMKELSDDMEIVDVLWQILGAIVRPNVRWNKSAWFYSNTGNNGKGTLCELMRSLCGNDSYASIPLSDFGKDFALEPLVRATAIITDENDVGTYIDKAGNLKAIITNDVVSINRKFKSIISYQFFGFMVQCLNEFPRIKDKSDSFYRRQLFVPFTKCFTGIERKYIKEDYLHRPEVLEYVLYRVLHMNYYTLSEPESCKLALEEFKDFSDPVRQFAEEILPELVWDLVPFAFLYDLYRGWFKHNAPSGIIQGKNTFITDFLNVLKDYNGWCCPGRKKKLRPGQKMDKPEPLIYEYGLEDWKSPTYCGTVVNRICMPKLKVNYTGILRVGVSADDED